jgi:hypothetical protein
MAASGETANLQVRTHFGFSDLTDAASLGMLACQPTSFRRRSIAGHLKCTANPQVCLAERRFGDNRLHLLVAAEIDFRQLRLE